MCSSFVGFVTDLVVLKATFSTQLVSALRLKLHMQVLFNVGTWGLENFV